MPFKQLIVHNKVFGIECLFYALKLCYASYLDTEPDRKREEKQNQS